MNVCADKVWGTFLSLPFSLHQTVGRGCSTSDITYLTQVYGFTRWEKRNSADVQVWGICGKKYPFVTESAWKGSAPQEVWADEASPAQQCTTPVSSHGMWFSPRLTSPALISCQCNFTASTLLLAHSCAIRQQSICHRDLSRGAALVQQPQHCKEMQQHQCPGPQVGWEWSTGMMSQGQEQYGNTGIILLPRLSPQNSGAKLLHFPNGSWLCGYCGSSDHLFPGGEVSEKCPHRRDNCSRVNPSTRPLILPVPISSHHAPLLLRAGHSCFCPHKPWAQLAAGCAHGGVGMTLHHIWLWPWPGCLNTQSWPIP